MKGTQSERTDDLPVIIHWLQQMQIEKWLDQELPVAHGNRQGLSYGQLAVLLLTYMISQADHRLCAVEPWVAQHAQTLEWSTDWKISVKDATDDRLALPLLGATLPGQGTDESHYLPTWRQLVEILGHKDFLFLADCKASSWANRAKLDREGGIYCFPLAMSQPRPKILSDWIAHPPTTVREIQHPDAEETDPPMVCCSPSVSERTTIFGGSL